MKKKSKKILIIGFGLSAATIAQKASELGYQVDIYRNGDHVGGLCADTNKGSLFGPHIFHTNNLHTWMYINRFCTMVPYINSPIAEYEGKYYNLPINLQTLYQMYGTIDLEKIKESLEKDGVDFGGKGWPRNAEEACIMRVGKKFYETLFKVYTEKQWKTDVKEIDASVLQRVPTRFVWNNNYFNDLYQGIPLEGYSSLIREMTKDAKVIEQTKEAELLGAYKFMEFSKQRYDKIFICQELDKAFGYEGGKIPYLKTMFVQKASNDCPQIAVVNHCDKTTDATRTTSYRFLWPKDRQDARMSVIDEIPLGEDRDGCGNIADEVAVSWNYPFGEETSWTKNCYPARDTAVYKKYRDYADEQGFIVCGRLAENLYLDMGVAVENALGKVKEYL